MYKSLFIRFFVCLAVFAMLGVMASPASAGKPEKIYVNEQFDEELCGIPVHTTVDGFFKLHIQDYVIQADDPDVQDDFWIGVIQNHFNSGNACRRLAEVGFFPIAT